MGLFDGVSDPRGDLRTLIDVTREALASPSGDDRLHLLLSRVNDGMVWRTVAHLRAGRLPPAAFALAAGAAGIGIGKDYAVRPAWLGGHALLRGLPPAHVPGDLAAIRAKIERLRARRRAPGNRRNDADEWTLGRAYAEERLAELEERLRAVEHPIEVAGIEAGMEEARWEIAELRGHAGRNPPPPALARVARHAAPLGALEARLWSWAEERRALHQGRAWGPAWEGLRLTVDACAGGSSIAVDALGPFARKHEALIWPLWLREAACAFAGDRRRDEAARALDARLEGDPVASSTVRWVRAQLEARLAPTRDLWLTLAARRVDRRETPGLLSDLAAEKRRLEEGSSPAAVAREVLRGIEAALDDARRQELEDQETEGPFYDLRIDAELVEAFSSPLHYVLVVFRELYGAELARAGLAGLVN
jgi:hypothetical protein